MDFSVAEGVHFQASLPLVWLPACDVSALESSRYLAVLAEFEYSGEDRQHEHAELHAKLDLALLWLARSVAGDMPPACAASMGLELLRWQAPAQLAAGYTGAVALNLSAALPFLLQLPAQIISCDQGEADWNVCARLLIEDTTLRDWWERTVFRRHRRAIQLERGRRA